MALVRHLYAPARSAIGCAALWYCALISLPGRELVAQVPGTLVLRTTGAESLPAERGLYVDTVLDQYGTVVFRHAPLDQALYALGQQWQVKIINDGEVTGTATGIFRRATLREILDAVLTDNGYAFRKSDSTITIVRSENLKSATVPRVTPARTSSVIQLPPPQSPPLPSPSAQSAVVSSAIVQVQEPPPSQSLPNVALPNVALPNVALPNVALPNVALPNVALPSQLIPGQPAVGQAVPDRSASDAPVEILKLRPQYVSAADLSKAIESTVGGYDTMTTLEGDNVLLVAGSSETLARAQDLMTQLDVPPGQLQLHAYLFQVRFEDVERIASQWNGNIDRHPLLAPGAQEAAAGKAPASNENIFSAVLPKPMNCELVVKSVSMEGQSQLIAQHSTLLNDRQAYSIESTTPHSAGASGPAAASNQADVWLDDIEFQLEVVPRLAFGEQLEIDTRCLLSRPKDPAERKQSRVTLQSQAQFSTTSGQVLIVGIDCRSDVYKSAARQPKSKWKTLFGGSDRGAERNGLICVLAVELANASPSQPSEKQAVNIQPPANAERPIYQVGTSVLPADTARKAEYRPSVYPSAYSTTSQGQYRPSVYR